MHNQQMDKPIPYWREKLPVAILIIFLVVNLGIFLAHVDGVRHFFFGNPNLIVLDGIQYEFKEATVFTCSPNDDMPILPCRRMVVEQCYVDSDECDYEICWDCTGIFVSDDSQHIMARHEDGSVTRIRRVLP